ncbi:hypothetical protein [uncultured Flavobacterium sp.]|uniref:hypothetical protein n=1 Tax=uncultured Flavobacterium sp. TaxID=165435 RepID=UPI0025D569BC|nr:hypothetical protein [uncultured Flavobacterium sp.]
MKNFHRILPFLILIISCSNKNETPVTTNLKVKDSITVINNDKQESNDSDCIFDNKPKELTEEWLKEAGFDNFTWDNKKEAAIVINDGDTLFVYKGGCDHLVSSVEFTTKNVNNNLFDVKQMQKINDLACKFKFENYCNKILNNQYDKIESNTATYILEFEDDDPEDNLIYNGIEITEIGDSIHIKISEYYN